MDLGKNNSIDEVACIHTVTDYTMRTNIDQPLCGINKMAKEDADGVEAIADGIIKKHIAL